MSYKLTLGIPTYNRLSDIQKNVPIWAQQIENLNQQGFEIQLFISDNSTNDETQNYIKDKSANKSYFKYMRNQNNCGFGYNINNLILNADAEYLWIIGDNDLPLQNSLEKVYELFQKHPNYIFYALNNDTIDEATGKLAHKERYFDHTTEILGHEFVKNSNYFYSLGAVGTGIYRCKEAREVIKKIKDLKTIHQNAVISGVLIYNQKLMMCQDPFYIDTIYNKNYTVKAKYETTIESHLRTVQYIEKVVGKNFIPKKTIIKHCKGRFRDFILLSVFSDLSFKLAFKKIVELFSFSLTLGFWGCLLNLAFFLKSPLFERVVSISLSLIGKNVAGIKKTIHDVMVSKMSAGTYNKYLDATKQA